MASAHTDAYLIERYLKGEQSAMDELVRRHQARAYQYAFRLTRDRDTAADLVADAFLRVFRSVDGFKGQSAFTTWLYRIITNCFLDARKKASARPTSSLDDAMETPDGELQRQFESEDESPFDLLDRRMRAQALADAIEALPEVHRAIVQMYHGEMLSYEEIAEVLSVPIGTVKSRLNRARVALAQQLASKREDLVAA
jgi:RNA polymerase sigma-70 factor (ECF subfamily)